mmetsp:Transcript_7719/g.21504  ORF Transcript_7719/g.21504 Transcript_7719/m.21504 type:complete len:217 (+) Transcript_7719:143-793(+)
MESASSQATSASTSAPSLEVQMLRKKVKFLTSENERLKKELAEARKKRPAAAPSLDASPSKKARTAGQKKKLFEKWAKALIRESKKHKISTGYGVEMYDVTVKDAGLWTPAEFAELFQGQGKKIQPLPDNKPTSVITILDFTGFEEINRLFSTVGGMTSLEEKGYQVQVWRQRNFQKSYHSGDRDASLTGLRVHYNKSKQALSFVFMLGTDGDTSW